MHHVLHTLKQCARIVWLFIGVFLLFPFSSTGSSQSNESLYVSRSAMTAQPRNASALKSNHGKDVGYAWFQDEGTRFPPDTADMFPATATSLDDKEVSSRGKKAPGAPQAPSAPGWVLEDVYAPHALYATDATFPNDVWAVGGGNSTDDANRNTALRWDGVTWSAYNPPSPERNENYLFGTDFRTPFDGWAVGYGYGDAQANKPYAFHWNGTKWTSYPVPNRPNTVNNILHDVATFATNDAWAVGAGTQSAGYGPLVVRWNGTQWNYVSLANSGMYTELRGISGTAANDFWVVGNYYVSATQVRAYAARYNGTGFTVATLPLLGGTTAFESLEAVKVIASNDVWAVGWRGDSEGNSHPVAAHYDGSTWSSVNVDLDPIRSIRLMSVAGTASNDVWAAGYDVNQALPYILHYNGTSWQETPAAAPGYSTKGKLYGVTALSPDLAYTVGGQGPNVIDQKSLVERWDLDAPTPTPTNTPDPNVTPSATRAPVATATPRACEPNFTDVHEDDWFYEYVAYMYCNHVVGGYSDSTFRPNANTTRGQLAKILYLAMDLPPNAQGGPHFSDVPTDNPFYAYIETVYNLGIVSGYDDGTFRPSNNVTRGQIAKMVVLAAKGKYGWQLSNRNTATFNDVAVGSPFFQYIETAVEHSILGGYPCGSPGVAGEPCPGTYFRPSNLATRAHISKIVYLALPEH